jgi:hypothetical protein
VPVSTPPVAQIQTVTYLIEGVKPTPRARESADTNRAKIPGAQIHFQPDPAFQPLIDDLARPTYDLERIVEDRCMAFSSRHTGLFISPC